MPASYTGFVLALLGAQAPEPVAWGPRRPVPWAQGSGPGAQNLGPGARGLEPREEGEGRGGIHTLIHQNVFEETH